MKRSPTHFLRLVIILMAAVAASLCIWAVPALMREGLQYSPDIASLRYVILFGFYAPILPFFIILLQGMKLLSYIDNNRAFSAASVRALGVIKYAAFAICVLYAAAMPFFYYVAQIEDAPGLIIFGGIPALASFVVSVFAAVLQSLIQNGSEIKSENDLTV